MTEFSEEERKRIIKEDDVIQINLFFGEDPYALGHIVIQPKSCANDISEYTEKEWQILSEWVPKVVKAMKQVLKKVLGREVQKIYLCSFNESPKYSVHFHLIPRYECETLKGESLLFYHAKAKLMIPPQARDKIVRGMKEKLKQKQKTI